MDVTVPGIYQNIRLKSITEVCTFARIRHDTFSHVATYRSEIPACETPHIRSFPALDFNLFPRICWCLAERKKSRMWDTRPRFLDRVSHSRAQQRRDHHICNSDPLCVEPRLMKGKPWKRMATPVKTSIVRNVRKNGILSNHKIWFIEAKIKPYSNSCNNRYMFYTEILTNVWKENQYISIDKHWKHPFKQDSIFIDILIFLINIYI